MSRRGRYFLLLIFSGFAITNAWVIFQNHTPLIYDEADYFLLSFRFHELLQHLFQVSPAATLKEALTLYKAWPEVPPLFSLFLSPAHFIPGFNQYLSPLVNLFYLGLLTFLVYRLGAGLRDEQTGILAAFLTLSMPSMFAFSRTLYLDFAFATVVTLNFFLIFQTQRSPSTRNFLLLGLATGAGMLYKFTFPIYTFIPLVILFLTVPRPGRLRNLAVFLSVSLLIVSPYCLTPLLNKDILAEHVGHYRHHGLLDSFAGISGYLGKLFVYLQSLCLTQMGWVNFILFVASLFYLLFSRSRPVSPALKFIILAWLIVPYLIIIALPFPTQPVNPRHVLPLLPGTALLVSLFLRDLKDLRTAQLPRSLRVALPRAYRLLCFFVVLWAAFQFLTVSCKHFWQPPPKLSSQAIYGTRFNYGLLSPYSIDLQQTEIFQAVRELGPRIIIVPDTPYPALIASLSLENELNQAPLELVYLQFYERRVGPEEIERLISGSGCLVVVRSQAVNPEESPEGIFALYDPGIHQLLNEAFVQRQPTLTHFRKFVLSDKEVDIYVPGTIQSQVHSSPVRWVSRLGLSDH